MNDDFNNAQIDTYNIDYRSMYDGEKSKDKVGTCIIRSEGTDKKREYGYSEEDRVTYVPKEETDKEELLQEIFELIKVSCRVLTTVFIIMLCVGLVALTVHLLNENNYEIEKYHIPPALLCMIRNGDCDEIN